MKVCIAEKPSVAKEIALILGARTRRDGYFEGNGYQVTWTFGHLCTLKEPHDYTDRWKFWRMDTLPMIPPKFSIKVIENEGVKKQFSVIKQLVSNAEEVINCGDAGQEGELIQRWVLSKAQCNKPVKRLWISSLTEESIREGFETLQDSQKYNRLFLAGHARAVGDWMLGMNATRLYSLKYGNGKQVLSIGRVQTPTLALVVERQLEIDHFKPEPFWELKTLYRETTFSVKSGRFSNIDEARIQLEQIKGKEFKITSVVTKEGNEYPPKLYDLTSLQVDCNRKFNLSAEETLRIIQKLYERKLTTYPRVDTTYLSNDIYKKVPDILNKLKPYENLVQPLMGKKIRKSNKVFDDKKVTDHHAIIPTGVFPNALNHEEKQVYDLVTRRFISVFYPDCKVSNTTVEGITNKIEFKASGKQILEPGWRVIYLQDSSKSQADENILPSFTEGEKGEHQPDLVEKMTQPPKYYTEATLLRAMETAGKKVDDEELRELMKENGIGRPSTRANIIETLYRRRYIRKEKKRLVATQTGIDLIQTIENDLLKSASLTGQWEKKLRQIEEGNYEAALFMEELKEMVTDIVVQVKLSPKKEIHIIEDEKKSPKNQSSDKNVLKAEKELICPKCKKGKILKGKSAWGCSGFQDGCEFRLPFSFLNKKLSDSAIKNLITKGKTGIIKGFQLENKESTDGILKLNSHFEIELEIREPEKRICPHCKKGEIVKGKSAWGCNNFKNGCRLIIPFEFEGKKITQSHLNQLLKNGKTSKIKGFLDSNGNKVDGILKLNSEYQLIRE